MVSPTLQKRLIQFQRAEATEQQIYRRLAKIVKGETNKQVLSRIAEEESGHYEFFKRFTKEDVKPNGFYVWFYLLLVRLLGLNFGVRLMEKTEISIQEIYEEIRYLDPEVEQVLADEKKHEEAILQLLDEERLAYTGAIVLGLNDALVELTGALAGLTLVLHTTRLIGIVGAVTGIAAALSMAGSEYLAVKEEGEKKPLKAAFYTGIAYITAVILLVLPFFLMKNAFLALGVTVGTAILIIFSFTFYISVAKNLSFRRRFGEMAFISLSVALINFAIGWIIRTYFGVDV